MRKKLEIAYKFPKLFEIHEFWFEGKKFVKIKNPEAAGILPVYNNSFVLLKEFRPVIKKYIISIPRGRVEKNETPESAAKRELLEEAGLKAKKVNYLFSSFNSPGISDEVTHIYYAEKFEIKQKKPEDQEYIKEVVNVPVGTFEKYFIKRDGSRKMLFDGATMLAILFYLKFRK